MPDKLMPERQTHGPMRILLPFCVPPVTAPQHAEQAYSSMNVTCFTARLHSLPVAGCPAASAAWQEAPSWVSDPVRSTQFHPRKQQRGARKAQGEEQTACTSLASPRTAVCPSCAVSRMLHSTVRAPCRAAGDQRRLLPTRRSMQHPSRCIHHATQVPYAASWSSGALSTQQASNSPQ